VTPAAASQFAAMSAAGACVGVRTNCEESDRKLCYISFTILISVAVHLICRSGYLFDNCFNLAVSNFYRRASR
jgi:hypothetical protein